MLSPYVNRCQRWRHGIWSADDASVTCCSMEVRSEPLVCAVLKDVAKTGVAPLCADFVYTLHNTCIDVLLEVWRNPPDGSCLTIRRGVTCHIRLAIVCKHVQACRPRTSVHLLGRLACSLARHRHAWLRQILQGLSHCRRLGVVDRQLTARWMEANPVSPRGSTSAYSALRRLSVGKIDRTRSLEVLGRCWRLDKQSKEERIFIDFF